MAQPAATKTQRAVPQEPVAETPDAKWLTRRFIREHMRFILPGALPLALSWTIGCRRSVSSARKSSPDTIDESLTAAPRFVVSG